MDKEEIIKDLTDKGCHDISVQQNGRGFLIKFRTPKRVSK